MSGSGQPGLLRQTNELVERVETVKPARLCPSIHLRLKLATRLEHRRVDHALSIFALGDPDEYAAFMNINHSALTALQPHWRREDEADFAGLVDALGTDLVDLGAEPSDGIEPLSGPIDGLGLSYVVRGSRLGSKILRKRVGADLPTSYFDFRMKMPWARFLDQIDLRGERGAAEEQALIAGALRTFAVYQRLARPTAAAA